MLRALSIFGALLFVVVVIGSSDASARDIASGQASGKRQYKPVVITKQTNKTSSKLMTKQKGPAQAGASEIKGDTTSDSHKQW